MHGPASSNAPGPSHFQGEARRTAHGRERSSMPRMLARRRRALVRVRPASSASVAIPPTKNAVPKFPSWAFPSPDIWIGQLRRDLSGKRRAPA